MEAVLRQIFEYLIAAGPVVVFVATLVETACFIGLLIPAEATVLLAAFLADRGTFEVEHVLIATLAGAWAGDQIGYALGRFGGRRFAARQGWLGRVWRRSEPRARILFRRRTIFSVTLARFVSFVRTLMPWFAGMSGMSYPRFLLFDSLGVLGWGCASVALGLLAGESWHRVAGTLGTASAIVVFLLIGIALIAFWRTRHNGASPSTNASGAVDGGPEGGDTGRPVAPAPVDIPDPRAG